MLYLCIVKKLVYIFLNTKYPDSFIQRTIFGDVCMYNGGFLGSHDLSKEIGGWFDMDKVDAKTYVDAWCSSLPVVVSIRNSTNPTVLVSDTVIVNSTL